MSYRFNHKITASRSYQLQGQSSVNWLTAKWNIDEVIETTSHSKSHFIKCFKNEVSEPSVNLVFSAGSRRILVFYLRSFIWLAEGKWDTGKQQNRADLYIIYALF